MLNKNYNLNILKQKYHISVICETINLILVNEVNNNILHCKLLISYKLNNLSSNITVHCNHEVLAFII